MRSSDWSSDVCSSDLLRAGRSQRAVTPPPQRADRAQITGFPLKYLVLLRKQEPRIANAAVRDSGLLLSQEHCHQLTRNRVVAAILVGQLVVGVERRRDDRSEEHTSELQSLMRISYAVFCLQKKKKNNRHTTTTPINK